MNLFFFINPTYIIKIGETFGEISFFTGEVKSIKGKSLSVTHTAFIKRVDFINLIQKFPDDYVNIIYFI